MTSFDMFDHYLHCAISPRSKLAGKNLILSRAGPPGTASKSEEALLETMKEIQRVLKPGGTFRMSPGAINATYLNPDTLLTKEELAKEREGTFTMEDRIARVSERSLEYLQSHYPELEASEDSFGSGAKKFFSYTKPSKEQ